MTRVVLLSCESAVWDFNVLYMHRRYWNWAYEWFEFERHYWSRK